MTTQYISFTEARKNLSQLWKKAQKENIRYRVLLHSKPIFDISAVLDEAKVPWDLQFTEENKKARETAREELKNGETLSIEELQKELHYSV